MAKASIYLDTRRQTKDDLYPIKIRVTHGSNRKYYSTGYYVANQIELSKLFDTLKPVRGTKKVIRDKILENVSKAELCISSLSTFNFTKFEEVFLKKSADLTYTKVFSSFDAYREILKLEGKVSTASGYELAAKSLKKFLKATNKNQNLEFGDINKEWLTKYENWMTSNNSAQSTIGIYLRNLRTIFNVSISKGFVPQE